MYLLLISSVPLTFLVLLSAVLPREEAPQAFKTFLRGLIAFIPLIVLQLILRNLVPHAYGSPLGIFRLSWEYFFLPIVLALASWRLFEPFEKASRDDQGKLRFIYHAAGCLAPLGLVTMIESFGSHSVFIVFLWPVMLPALSLASLFLFSSALMEYGIRRILIFVGAGIAMLACGMPAWLLEARLEWLGILSGVIIAGASGYFAWSKASKLQHTPIAPDSDHIIES